MAFCLPLDLKISQNGCFAFAGTATLVCDLVVVVLVVVNSSNNLLTAFHTCPQVSLQCALFVLIASGYKFAHFSFVVVVSLR